MQRKLKHAPRHNQHSRTWLSPSQLWHTGNSWKRCRGEFEGRTIPKPTSPNDSYRTLVSDRTLAPDMGVILAKKNSCTICSDHQHGGRRLCARAKALAAARF